MISGETLIHTLQRPSTGRALFSAPIYAQAENFDALAQRRNQDLHRAYRDTIHQEFSTDLGKRAASLTLSTSMNDLRLLDKEPAEYSEVDRHHAEAARLFAALPPEQAAALAEAANRQRESRDRLFAFRQFLPEKNHADGEHLRALVPMLPHLPEAARAHETRELFSRVAQLPRNARARTVAGIAKDVERDLGTSREAERAQRPVAAHLVKQLERIDNGAHAVAAFKTVHALAARIDDGLIRDEHAPLLEPRAINLMRKSAHGRGAAVMGIVEGANRRLMHAWMLNLARSGRRHPEKLVEIIGRVPEPPELPSPSIAPFARESMLPSSLLERLDVAKHVPKPPKSPSLASFARESILPPRLLRTWQRSVDARSPSLAAFARESMLPASLLKQFDDAAKKVR